MMAATDEDKKIHRITEFLEKGGTMLATHHECGAPMFRYRGKVLCPVCDYQAEQDKEQEIKTGQVSETTGKMMDRKENRQKNIPVKDEYNQIAVLTRNKIQNIAASLENETELGRVKDKMECIEVGIKILKLLENLQ